MKADDLEDLYQFVAKFQTEVQGRGRTELSDEDKGRLTSLAAGEVGEGDRKEIVQLLARNEVAMEYLAEILR